MSVRKRTWQNAAGEAKTAWAVDYRDSAGKRRLKTFKLKKDADAFAATASVEVRLGNHVADAQSVTVAKAGAMWLDASEMAGLERSTVRQYRQHVDLHIVPMIGGLLLSKLTIPIIRDFEDRLRASGRSESMARKVMVSLGSLLADAQERGLASRNLVRDRTGARRKGAVDPSKRHKGRLRVGVDIPTPQEVKAFVGALDGRWKPILLMAVFTGMRASELRGLTWPDVDLGRGVVHVRQRADRFNKLGPPKSAAGERSIPLPPIVVETLTAWRDDCPAGRLGLVFPNGAGNVEGLGNIRRRGLVPAMERAGVVDDDGTAKYAGMHALRHFYASWCINRVADGGLGLPAKMVQERLGHATINMTLDVYGHLFASDDTGDELAKAQEALLG